VWFGAAANHCAIYGVVGDHKESAPIIEIYFTSSPTRAPTGPR
jgi:hypothetical protein